MYYSDSYMHGIKTAPDLQVIVGYKDVFEEYITKTRLFQYIEKISSKNLKFSDKKLRYFSHFCSKHRLWILVRTASARWF